MRLQQYLKEGPEDADPETEQMLSDFIEMFIEDGFKKKEDHYRKIYKETFGREYQPVKEFIPKPSLDKVYSKDDFKRYQDYISYSEKLYILKFSTYKGLATTSYSNPEITWNQTVDWLSGLEVAAKLGNPRGTEGAWVTNDKEVTFKKSYEKNKVSKELLIHEMGHILDHKLNDISLRSNGDLFLHNMKATNYDMNPAEIFADSFMTYFIYPKYLKAGWKEVYAFFEKKIPGKWKKAVKELLKMK